VIVVLSASHGSLTDRQLPMMPASGGDGQRPRGVIHTASVPLLLGAAVFPLDAQISLLNAEWQGNPEW
jgi:hypothetical protein